VVDTACEPPPPLGELCGREGASRRGYISCSVRGVGHQSSKQATIGDMRGLALVSFNSSLVGNIKGRDNEISLKIIFEFMWMRKGLAARSRSSVCIFATSLLN
jgi:hypothetical protein